MNRGFTLLELMGVIALLGILALIAIPAIDRTLNSSKEKLSATQEKQIIKGAKEFFSDTNGGHNNIYCLPGNENNNKCYLKESGDSENDYYCTTESNTASCSISIGRLKAEGYLPYEIRNPKTGDDYLGVVTVTKKDGNYVYKVVQFDQETDETEDSTETDLESGE